MPLPAEVERYRYKPDQIKELNEALKKGSTESGTPEASIENRKRIR
jgi:hypothetical protein